MKRIIKFRSGTVFSFESEGEVERIPYEVLNEHRDKSMQLLGEKLFGKGFTYIFEEVKYKTFSKSEFEKYYNECAI